jgi:putative ABC transport system permease protein
MTEGLLLLTLATIPAILIDLNLAYVGLNTSVDGVTLAPGRFIVAVAITYVLIALMIFFGNLMPARKAMKVQPAEALHEE